VGAAFLCSFFSLSCDFLGAPYLILGQVRAEGKGELCNEPPADGKRTVCTSP